jgi:glycosyltransferase involved in cell wall biosynthesis
MNVSNLQLERLPRPPSGKLTIFYYGIISRERGVDILCTIMADLPEVTLILAGDGDLAGYVRTFALKHKNVQYLGWISPAEIETITNQKVDVIAILTDRFYVQSPLTHTLSSPRKLFTGMSKSLPVLVSEGGIMSDIVEKYRCGLVLDFKDIAKCRKDIANLRDNPVLLNELSENGFKASHSAFNWAIMETRLKDLCSKMKFI